MIENDSVVKMDVNDMDNYLKGYGLNMRLLKMDKYEREYFGYKESEESLMMTDVTVARAKNV